MIEIVPRAYQVEQIAAIDKRWRLGEKRTLISAPTGVGKTIVFVLIAKTALGNGRRTVVLVNSDELVWQAVQKFEEVGIVAGVVKQQQNDWHMDIVVASVQTIRRRLNLIPPNAFDLVVVDECHFANAESYRKVMEHFKDRYFLGVSATLFRGDGQSLAKAGWQSIAHIYTIDQALKDGWLVPPVAYRIQTQTDLRDEGDLEDSSGNIRKAVEQRINNKARNKLIVDSWLNCSWDRSTVGFCAGISHVYDLANAFRARGIDARPIEGGMPLELRRQTLRAHKQGEFPVLLNFGILTHGYDDPRLSSVIMARPIGSKPLFIQCVGRGLRPCEDIGKTDCLVLDFVDVCADKSLVTTPDVVQLCQDIKDVEAGKLPEPVRRVRQPRQTREARQPVQSRQAGVCQTLGEHPMLVEPATREQRRVLYEKLKKELAWSDSAARNAAFNPEMTKAEIPKFLSRAKFGMEAASNYE